MILHWDLLRTFLDLGFIHPVTAGPSDPDPVDRIGSSSGTLLDHGIPTTNIPES